MHIPRTSANPVRSASRLRLLVALVLVVVIVASACGDTSTPEPGAVADPITSTTTATGDGGWLDGSPADADDEFASDRSTEFEAGGGGVSETAVDAASEPGAPMPAPGGEAPTEPPPDQGPLTAGSVDDNADFAGYLDYRARIAELGIPVRDLDVSVRHVVVVTGADGLPVAGEPVEVLADGASVGVVRTGADGRALVHPLALGAAPGAVVELAVGEQTMAPVADGVTEVTLGRDGGAPAPVALDVFFVLDATGSMSDELDRLTATVTDVADRIAGLEGAPDVRLGMTVYRDEGDAFVTRTFDFTGDVAAFQAALAEVRADGGGDTPEAVDEALAAALVEPAWRDPATTVQLMFVLADAPPQIGRQVEVPYDAALLDAAARGVRIFPVASSGADDQAEYVFRQLAQFTGGRFVFLSYGVGGAALGEDTDITAVDYEELPLEDLLVRLVAEELAALTGGDTPLPPPESTTTTIDPGQQQDEHPVLGAPGAGSRLAGPPDSPNATKRAQK